MDDHDNEQYPTDRKVDRLEAGKSIAVLDGILAPKNVHDALLLAEVMALGGIAVPAWMREHKGVAMKIIAQAARWHMDAYAVADKSYEVNGKIAYESQLIAAILMKNAPIKGGRPKITYRGEGQNRRCKVWAIDIPSGYELEYETPPLSVCKLKSPLWEKDPDQQLYYYAIRAFGRRHYPDVIMGCYDPQELREEMRDITPSVVDNRLDDEPPKPVIVQEGEAAWVDQ
jgi:hypothetical protein